MSLRHYAALLLQPILLLVAVSGFRPKVLHACYIRRLHVVTQELDEYSQWSDLMRASGPDQLFYVVS